MATTSVRQRLIELVKILPESELYAAERYLQFLAEEGGVQYTTDIAPYDDEPLTEEDIAALAEAYEELRRGEGTPDEELRL